MDLFSTYIQIDKNESIADKVLEPCKKILSETKKNSSYKFGKTSYYDVSIWTEYRNDFNELYDNSNEYSFNINVNNVNYLLKTDSNKIHRSLNKG